MESLDQLTVVSVNFFAALLLGDHCLDDSIFFELVHACLLENSILLELYLVQVQLLMNFLGLTVEPVSHVGVAKVLHSAARGTALLGPGPIFDDPGEAPTHGQKLISA